MRKIGSENAERYKLELAGRGKRKGTESTATVTTSFILEDDSCSQSRLKVASTSGNSTMTSGGLGMCQLDWNWEQQHNSGYELHVSRRTHDNDKCASPSKRESYRVKDDTISPFTKYVIFKIEKFLRIIHYSLFVSKN